MISMILIFNFIYFLLRFGHGNPLINPNLFEGDILLQSPQRTLATLTSRRWPSGIIPYEFSISQFTQTETNTILEATIDLQEKLNANGIEYIQFVPRTNQRNFIKFLRNAGFGCASYVGLINIGEQLVSLDNGCVFRGIIQHELLHAIGIFHEQSRPDRDDYVTIFFDNIQKGTESNFEKYTSSVSVYDLPYDYGSLMHYAQFDFAIDRSKPTIIPKQANTIIGQRLGPSSLDIEVVRRYYASLISNSTGTTQTTTTTRTTTRTTTITTTTRSTSPLTTTTRSTTPRTTPSTSSSRNNRVTFKITGSLIIKLSTNVTNEELESLIDVLSTRINEALRKTIYSLTLKNFRLIIVLSRSINAEATYRDTYELVLGEGLTADTSSIRNDARQAATQVQNEVSSGSVTLPMRVNLQANTDLAVETTSTTTAKSEGSSITLESSPIFALRYILASLILLIYFK